LLATGAEWTVQAWAERASGNVEHNAEVRSRLSNPLEYPIGGAIAIGIIVYAFSRVMLWLSKTNTVIAFSVVALVFLLVAFFVARRPKMKISAVGGLMAIGALAMVGAGTLTGLDGERDIPLFETTSVWQEEGILHPAEYAEGAAAGEHPAALICESPDEFPEADEDVSQTVANKSGAYQVFLSESGELTFDVPGPIELGATGMVIPRSNPTNIIFRNQSNEHRRLSLDLGTQLVEIEEGGETVEVEAPNQLCTTLIEPGGAQLVTVNARVPSFANAGIENPNGPPGADGYWFFVPGVDTAQLELIVP
jgi:hypothetical protein